MIAVVVVVARSQPVEGGVHLDLDDVTEIVSGSSSRLHRSHEYRIIAPLPVDVVPARYQTMAEPSYCPILMLRNDWGQGNLENFLRRGIFLPVK